MIRRIIHIDEDKCDGCGLCAKSCHEGAIDIIGGKAKLSREHFCDGLGDCLPNCPRGAITFEEREAPAYDEAAVKASQAARQTACPGTLTKESNDTAAQGSGGPGPVSRLGQWPCQIKLMPLQAPYYEGADLLIAADCTAYAYAGMHEDFMKDRVTLIGCPKLDAVDYTDKLTAIIAGNSIRSVTLVRMEVPCCGGLQRAVENAIRSSGRALPLQIFTISCKGQLLG